MEVTKVRTAVLREMKFGQSKSFKVPDGAAVESGKNLAYRMGRILGCKFSARADYDNMILTITKTATQ